MQGSPAEVVCGIDGRVWEARATVQEADALAARLPVVNVHYAGDGTALVRFLSDGAPAPELAAAPVAPTLEDLYLHVFNEGGGADA